jgi:glycosyltransferase involved in cell wall biosynthesis
MHETECKVTIGIPLYNAENYIKPCLTCALEQDLRNIEILVVNDCATDNSINIVLDIQKTHSNGNIIRIISHPQNMGVAEARNTIIHNALGKYIFFLDSDDYIFPNTLSTLYAAAEKNQAEITFGSTTMLENGKETILTKFPNRVIQGRNSLAEYIYGDINENFPCTVWNRLYLTEFIQKNNILFPHFKVDEDLLFSEQITPVVEKAVLLSDFTYCYNKRVNSLMNFQAREVIDIKEVHNSFQVSQLLKQYCIASKNMPYYDKRLAKTMKMIFFSVCGVLKHRHHLSKTVSDYEIRNFMIHPAKLIEIICFKHQRTINLIFWLMGVLPPILSVALMTFIGKRKGFI